MSPSQRGGVFFRLLVLILFLALLLVLYLVRRPILQFAGELLIVEDPMQPSDVLIVLGGDNLHGDRAARAAELYRGRWAPRVVASGPPLRSYASEADLTYKDLSERGVPADALIRLAHSAQNTHEEAQAIRRLVAARGWERVLIVTSNYHTRRSRYIFRRVLPASVQVCVVSAPDHDFDSSTWWHTRRGQKLFLDEWAGMLIIFWELRALDENVPPAALQFSTASALTHWTLNLHLRGFLPRHPLCRLLHIFGLQFSTPIL